MKGFSSIADVIMAARLDKGLTQGEIAKAIGVHQATYSRFENGISIPTVLQWEDLCTALDLPYDTGKHKMIDRCEPISGNREILGNAPKNYQARGSIKIRFLIPMLAHLQTKDEGESLADVINSLGFDKSYFVQLDNELNLKFLSDFLETTKLTSSSPSRSLADISKFMTEPANHGGSLMGTYSPRFSRVELLRNFAENQKFYQAIYNVKLSSGANVTRLSLQATDAAKPFLLEMPYKHLMFLSEYMLQFISKTSLITTAKEERKLKEVIVKTEDPLNPGSFDLKIA